MHLACVAAIRSIVPSVYWKTQPHHSRIQLVPLLKHIQAATPDSTSATYVALACLLLMSQDDSFNHFVHEQVRIKGNPPPRCYCWVAQMASLVCVFALTSIWMHARARFAFVVSIVSLFKRVLLAETATNQNPPMWNACALIINWDGYNTPASAAQMMPDIVWYIDKAAVALPITMGSMLVLCVVHAVQSNIAKAKVVTA
jgi:hypothetical protein